jgi:Uma2 family endonuclease
VDTDFACMLRDAFKPGPSDFAQPNPVLLAIEIAESNLDYDRKVKARLYARYGVHEYWVIDAHERITWIHTGPSADGWSSVVKRGPGETLTTSAAPGFAIRLDQIG